MYSKIKTCTLMGLSGFLVEVEANIAQGMNNFSIVGLPDTSIKESKERVRTALLNAGHKFPLGRVTINLSPANLRKEGSQLDLPIAVAMLSCMGVIDGEIDVCVLGELTLDGRINGVQGALPMVISLRDLGYKKFLVPYENREECSVIDDVEIYPVKSLQDSIDFLNGDIKIMRTRPKPFDQEISYQVDFSDIKGQETLKRAMEISAAGMHNLLMIGPPGSGKTMAASRLPTIMPPLEFEEAVQTTKIYSVSGKLEGKSLIKERPFRAPHHTASQTALVGGGRIPKPGEISLAHNGVLFLDELPEFSKSAIEVLRQPLESHEVTVARTQATVKYPANFLLVASANPCPCGYYGDPNHECKCSSQQINNYLGKLSKPLLDRIDIHCSVEAVSYEDLRDRSRGESSEEIRKRVIRAREIQRDRYLDEEVKTNGLLSSRQVRKYIKLSSKQENILKLAFEKYAFSARAFDKILKISRTLADLSGTEDIRDENLLEAIRYRTMAKKYFE